MNKCHTVLWTNDYCRKLKRSGDIGKSLRVLFGGPHQSQPSLSAFGVIPGDYVLVIRVEKGRLFLVGGIQVQEYVTLSRYLSEMLELPESYASLHLWELEATLESEHPEWGHLLPWGCPAEVALGVNGTPIRLDLAVPTETVERLRFTSKRGERPIRHVEGGLIKSSVSLQGGAYRLTTDSGRELMQLIYPTGGW